MAKSFLSRIKNLFPGETPFRITRAFAIKMLPLSFLAGIFICVAIPLSYYFVGKTDMAKQAGIHADYLASIFRNILERHPLTWEQEISSYVSGTQINVVKFFDRRHDLISEISSGKIPPSWSMVVTERKVDYGGKTYAYVSVGISLEDIESNALKLLLFSLMCGTVEGILLFLIPVFCIQDVEERVNRSRQELLDKQKSLSLSEEKYRSLFELAPDGIFISTINGRIVSCNQSFLQMFQLDEKKAASVHAGDLYADTKMREKIIPELLRHGRLQNIETTFKKMDGTEIPVLLSLQVIKAGVMSNELHEGEDVLIEAIIRDITAKKEVERQLIQAQKMESIGLLAGGVAHDFNNLLAGILGYASLISGQSQESSDLRRYAEIIEQSAVRASELTQKLLAFARAGKYTVEVINLNDTVNEVVAILNRTLGKDISLSVEPDPDLEYVEADPSQMSQVLLNLCVNARDAMPDGGRLLVRTFNTFMEKRILPDGDSIRPGNYVGLSVIDTGTGIDEKTMQHIFEPFYSTKETGRGTGLGLSMVYGIVKNHRGYIDVKSSSGEGTVFTVYIPASTARNTDCRHEKTEVDVTGGNETILIIDDEEVIRDLGREILEDKDYRVLLAEDGEKGTAIFRERHAQIDMVLLDMVMPGKNGVEVFRELKSIDPEVKVVLVSGYSMDEKAREVLENGALAFIRKPYHPGELLKKIRELLESRSSR